MTHLVLGKDKHGKFISIIGEGQTADAAATIGEASKAVDYHVIPPSSLAELSMKELVAIFNHLAPKEDAVTRFETCSMGATRILALWEKIKFQIDVPTPKRRPKAKPDGEPNGKKVRTKTTAASDATIKVHAAPAKKRWQANSDRKKVYDWLAAHPDSTVGKAIADCGVPAKKVPGCLSKLVSDELITIKKGA